MDALVDWAVDEARALNTVIAIGTGLFWARTELVTIVTVVEVLLFVCFKEME